MSGAIQDAIDAEVVQLLDRTVEVAVRGAGAPVIVLESGLTDDLQSWQPVFAQLAERSKTIAYSRPGYGRSSATSSPRHLRMQSEELRLLLHELRQSPPFVLVGHSFGGLIAQGYAAAHPQEVAGLVLVDAPHPDLIEHLYAAATEDGEAFRCMTSTLSGIARAEFAALTAPGGGHYPGEGNPYPGPMVILAAWLTSFGSVAHRERRRRLAEEVATCYRQAELRKVTCGHYIHRERPLAVIDAVDEVLARVRAASVAGPTQQRA
jgi:pimeloyl-ACP methyl ester carboxylesterase